MLEYSGNGTCRPLDSDILSGKRFFRGETPNLAALRKKFGAHQLLISTVWERYFPVAVALGPQADESEDPAIANLARVVIGELGGLMGAKVVHVDQPGLAKAFGTQRGRSLKAVVAAILSAPLGSRNRCLTLAAAAGLYAIATTGPPPADRLLSVGL